MKLRFTTRAAAELDELLGYIRTQSPQGAAKVNRRIQFIAEILVRYPEAGARTSIDGLRRIVVQPYRHQIFYRATADEILVIGVRHGARRPTTDRA